MTSCPSDERLAQLLEEQLDRRELVDIERHLERCGHCQDALEELTRDRFRFDEASPWSESAGDLADRSGSRPGEPRGSRSTHHTPTQFSSFGPDLPVDAIPEVDGYEILERIGQGGMGVVYKARQGGLERLVALKMIRGGGHAAPEHLARFRIEARAVARLGHPNVVQIYDVGRSAGVPFVALELLEGGSLEGRVGGTPQPERSSAELLVILARAMATAHRAGVVHRDLKSANVLFSADGTPKIADFGLAKRLDEEDGQTQTGQVMGSPSFMAPEQARGREVGPLADVYSLGAILYEMLTGRPPFKGSSPMETLFQVVHDEPLPPTRLRPGLSRDLETIALKCLAKEPGRRYESAGALADDLDRYLAGSPILARPIGLREWAWKWARRQPALATLGLVALLAVVGFGSFTWRAQHVAAWQAREDQRADASLVVMGDHEVEAAQVALHDRNYEAGLERLNKFLQKISGNPRLAPLRDRVQGLIVLLQEGQQRQKLEAATRRQLASFRDLRRQAQIQDVQAIGFGEFRDLDSLRKGAVQALEVFAAGAPKGEPEAGKLPPSLTVDERDEVEKARYELLLILAGAVARTLPGEEPRAQADRALAILDRALRLSGANRGNQAYHLLKAECLARKGDGVTAEAERRAASTLPADAFGHLLAGEALHRQERWTEAIQEFETALRLEPGLFRAQLLLAVSQLQTKHHFSEARTNLTACIQREPKAISLYLLRGFASGEEGYALRQKGEDRSSPRPETLLKEAEAQFEAAEADFQFASTLAPNLSEKYVLLVNRGAFRLRRHRLDDAVSNLVDAIALKPDEVSAYIVLGQVYRQQGRIDAALAQFTRGIALKPEIAALYRSRALTRLDRGRPSPEVREESLGDLAEAIRLDRPGDPEFARDRSRRARLLLQAGRASEALVDCEDALRAFPKDSEALLVRVRSLIDLKRFDDVLAACDDAIARGRPSGELYELRGLARASRSEYSAAIQDYTQSLALDPSRSTPLIQRGWAYLVSEAPSLALRDFDEAIRIAPEEPDGYNGRGFARVLQGQLKEAVEDAETSILKNPNDHRTHYNAARIYAKAANVVTAGNPRRAPRPIVEAYQDRAQTLIRLTLERMPASERGEFWRTIVEADPTLTALRQRPKFSQMAGQYGRMAK